jgi:4-hydroxy-tetrahydrodipicolinate synthase
VPLIFGVGTNDTKTTLKYAHLAEKYSPDGLLAVTPYYNKGTDEGVVKHYKTLAESTDLPIILYNVPSRTGVNLSLSAIEALADLENIAAIKEASDSTDRLTSLSLFSDKIALYSGNDSQIYTALALGGAGVISVLSNIAPCEVLAVTRSYFEKRYDDALAYQKAILPKVNAIFAETNPSPIKYAMSLCGFCKSEMRLPLTEPKTETKKLLSSLFKF